MEVWKEEFRNLCISMYTAKNDGWLQAMEDPFREKLLASGKPDLEEMLSLLHRPVVNHGLDPIVINSNIERLETNPEIKQRKYMGNKLIKTDRLKQIIILTIIWLAFYQGILAQEHPHLLFKRSDLPVLREKITQGVPQRAYQGLLKRCEAQLKAEKLSDWRSDCRPGSLTELALAWQLSGDKKFADKIVAEVSRLRQENADLSKIKQNWALVYDLGYDILADQDRQYLKKYLLQQAAKVKIKGVPGLSVSNFNLIIDTAGIKEAAALTGEPGFKQKWLDDAATNLRQLYSQFIGQNGEGIEHGAYFDYGTQLNGGLATWILKQKGYDLTKNTNLQKLPEWIIFETSPVSSHWLPMSDCSFQPKSNYSLRLFHALMPDNPLMNYLANQPSFINDSNPDAISGIIYYRPPSPSKKLDELISVPKAKCFRDANLVHYRNSWNRNALAFSTQARWVWGHCHADVGSFMLWSNGIFWAIDSGYGENAPEAHNLVLIDGKGPSNRGNSGELITFLETSFAVLIGINAKPTWNQNFQGHFDWLTLRPSGNKVQKAKRYFTIVQEDKNLKIPPYLLIYDNIKKDNQERVYSWTMQTEKTTRVNLKDNQIVLSVDHFDKWLQGLGEKGHPRFEQEIEVPSSGTYFLYGYCRGNDRGNSNYVDAWIDKQKYGYLTFGGTVWAWRILNNRKKGIKLEKGKHTISVSQHPENQMRFSWLMLSKKNTFTHQQPETIKESEETVCVRLGKNTRFTKGWHWVENKTPPGVLDLYFLTDKKAELKKNKYICKFRFNKGKWNQRLSADFKSTGEPFITLLYPRLSTDAPLPLVSHHTRYGYQYQIVWPNAVDYISLKNIAADGAAGEFGLVRVPRNGAIPHKPLKYMNIDKLPKSLSYVLAGGSGLRFGKKSKTEKNELLTIVDTYESKPRPAFKFGLTANTICSGETLVMEVFADPDKAKWLLKRPIRVRAYGSNIQKVVLNGKPTPFTRDGDYVVFDGHSTIFTSTSERIQCRIQKAIDNRTKEKSDGKKILQKK